MKFGICCSVEEAPAALAAGFDYVELAASQLLDREIEYLRVGPEITNVFFAGGYSIYGAERERALRYATETIEAASRVGIELMVIGSAGARRAPSDDLIEECDRLFVDVAAEISRIAQPFGITIAPESLGRAECNVGVDLGRLATALHAEGVAYTADSYHVISEWVFAGNEAPPPLEHWREQMPFKPAHVHIGSRPRMDPQPGDPDLVGFVERLAELGYDERVSLECRRFNDQNLSAALAQVRELFNR